MEVYLCVNNGRPHMIAPNVQHVLRRGRLPAQRRVAPIPLGHDRRIFAALTALIEIEKGSYYMKVGLIRVFLIVPGYQFKTNPQSSRFGSKKLMVQISERVYIKAFFSPFLSYVHSGELIAVGSASARNDQTRKEAGEDRVVNE